MKTEKSSTRKELAEIDIEKIRRFTQAELDKLNQGPLPFCYQIGADTLIVGKYKIIKIDNKCWRVMQGPDQLFDFFNRKDAIFYCIAKHKKREDIAVEIQIADNLVGALEFDATLYRYRYRRAQESNDLWNVELFSNKYTETMAKLEQAKKQLKKSLESAKYIKV